jgi:hypothetical protein
MQTTASDISAGWKYFRSWKYRFSLSTHTGRALEPRGPRDLIYLADHNQIRFLELNGEMELSCDARDARDQKIAFMGAYISLVATESHGFEADVRHLLHLQMRSRAPSVLGFWFWQSDIAKFGGGVSPFFQGESVSIFCERNDQIDFSDISSILPFDRLTVRHPTKTWDEYSSQELVDHIVADLAFDGHNTKISYSLDEGFLNLIVRSPDYGLR